MTRPAEVRRLEQQLRAADERMATFLRQRQGATYVDEVSVGREHLRAAIAYIETLEADLLRAENGQP